MSKCDLRSSRQVTLIWKDRNGTAWAAWGYGRRRRLVRVAGDGFGMGGRIVKF